MRLNVWQIWASEASIPASCLRLSLYLRLRLILGLSLSLLKMYLQDQVTLPILENLRAGSGQRSEAGSTNSLLGLSLPLTLLKQKGIRARPARNVLHWPYSQPLAVPSRFVFSSNRV